MKNHNCTSTPAPAACQPDNVRYLVSLFRKHVALILLWFLAPELEKKAQKAKRKPRAKAMPSKPQVIVTPDKIYGANRAGAGRKSRGNLGI